MAYTRIVLVTKRTPYEELILESGTHGNAAFLLQSRGEDIESYRAQHEAYQLALKQVEAAVPRDIEHTLVERSSVPRFLFRPGDLIVAVGPDGLFANLAKYLSGQPVIGINPLPGYIDGVVMRFLPSDSASIIQTALRGEVKIAEITLAQAQTPLGERLLAVNDFLVGRRDHISARYHIDHQGRAEEQSSSGVLVSTGLGASGWMRSVKTAVTAGWQGGRSKLLADPTWDERRLIFAVREPFPSQATGTSVVYGNITPDSPLSITSHMPEGGVVFSDGVPSDALPLPAGTVLTIGIAPERAHLVLP